MKYLVGTLLTDDTCMGKIIEVDHQANEYVILWSEEGDENTEGLCYTEEDMDHLVQHCTLIESIDSNNFTL